MPSAAHPGTIRAVRALRVLQRRAEALSAEVTAELGDLLADDASAAGLVRAATHAHAALDREDRRARSSLLAPACGAGCAYCCHVHVEATEPEILAVAAHLERTVPPGARLALAARLAEHAARVEHLTDDERWSAKIPCALLGDDGCCTVYPARPLRCRAFHSCAVDPCRAAFAGDPDADPQPSPALARAHAAVEDGYDRALLAAGLTPAGQRLHIGHYLARSGGPSHRIRPIDPSSTAEIALVARRMRETLVEVLGEARGTSLYTMDWLTQRVKWHLDPAESTAQVFLAERDDGHVAGHTIVRVDQDDEGRPIGLFSTTFVEPAERRSGLAERLLLRGEAWMVEHGMTVAVTDTSDANVKLINLFEKHGYRIVHRSAAMVRLARTLLPAG